MGRWREDFSFMVVLTKRNNSQERKKERMEKEKEKEKYEIVLNYKFIMLG